VLVLTRKTDEGIIIDDDIRVVIVEIRDNHVKLGIDAPQGRSIHREEVYLKILEENRAASRLGADDISIKEKGGLMP